VFTKALPTITASQYLEIAAACSGVDIPNPTPNGLSVEPLTISINSLILSGISFLTPVTPNWETQYMKPSPEAAISLILWAPLVGATRGIRYKYCSASKRENSPASSIGRSGTINPSTPALAASAATFDRP